MALDLRRCVRYAYRKPMELVFIVGIIIAIIGALTIAAVVWQGDSRTPAGSPIDAQRAAAPDAAVEAPAAPPPSDEDLAATLAAAFLPGR